MYYAYIINDVLNKCGQAPLIAEGLVNVEITKTVYDNIDQYIWDVETQQVILNPNYEAEQIRAKKDDLNFENTTKAKAAVENGYVEYKNAEFETNAQTVGDLTATMLLMQASGMESYQWLSKDDQVVELTLNDFGNLGALIAGYKACIWNEVYIGYKTQIEEAQTMEELNNIVIVYYGVTE